MIKSDDKRINLLVFGRVQGVFFRDSCRKTAKKLGLVGWVKNQPDGSVKICAEGREESLKKLIDWCYNGPRLAKVNKVKTAWQKSKNSFDDFEIKY